MITAKGGKCLYIMVLRAIITSLFHHLLRKILSTQVIVGLIYKKTMQLSYEKFSPLNIRTQLPQAAGVAYSLKMDNKEACVVAFMGDGATSEV